MRKIKTVGLLGGSFDPAHFGHLHISRRALTIFGLDEVRWLVSPQNPLKSHAPADFQTRFEAACKITAHDRRITVSDIETRLGTCFTAHTLHKMQHAYPRERFVWLMGADNLTGFHRWKNWHDILQSVPVGVLARPGYGQAGLASPMARAYRHARIPARLSRLLGGMTAPTWCYVNLPLSHLSSSAIRAQS